MLLSLRSILPSVLRSSSNLTSFKQKGGLVVVTRLLVGNEMGLKAEVVVLNGEILPHDAEGASKGALAQVGEAGNVLERQKILEENVVARDGF